MPLRSSSGASWAAGAELLSIGWALSYLLGTPTFVDLPKSWRVPVHRIHTCVVLAWCLTACGGDESPSQTADTPQDMVTSGDLVDASIDMPQDMSGPDVLPPTGACGAEASGCVQSLSVHDGAVCVVVDARVHCGELTEGAESGESQGAWRLEPVEGFRDAVDVQLGVRHGCGRTTSGLVRCWGDNLIGQLGVGELVQESDSPITVPGLVAVKTLLGAGMAQREDGRIFRWGREGVERHAARLLPQLDALGPGDVLGDFTWCALDDERRLDVCWGMINFSQVGLEFGVGDDPFVPRGVDFFGGPVDSLASALTSMCVVSDGALWCWGGDPKKNPVFPPSRHPGFLEPVHSVSAGYGHICVLRMDRTVACIDGLTGAHVEPIEVAGAEDAVHIDAGGYGLCVVHASGHLSCTASVQGFFDRGETRITLERSAWDISELGSSDEEPDRVEGYDVCALATEDGACTRSTATCDPNECEARCLRECALSRCDEGRVWQSVTHVPSQARCDEAWCAWPRAFELEWTPDFTAASAYVPIELPQGACNTLARPVVQVGYSSAHKSYVRALDSWSIEEPSDGILAQDARSLVDYEQHATLTFTLVDPDIGRFAVSLRWQGGILIERVERVQSD